MLVNLEIDHDDARFLYEQLTRHVEAVQIELAHTEKRELQRSLALDLARLQRIAGELYGALARESAVLEAGA